MHQGDDEASAQSDENEPPESASAAALAATMLDEEAARLAESDDAGPLFPDDLLPGVGSEELSVKEGIAKGGGAFTLVVLALLNGLDELEGAILTVLGPDIRDAFGVSNGTIVFITAASTSFFILGAIPLGWLADRVRRAPIIGLASLLFGFMSMLSGLAVNAFMLFLARFGAGIAKSNTIPVHGSLMADTYPIQTRGRLSAIRGMVNRGFNVLSPVLVGSIAALAGGDGWRWAYFLTAVPIMIFAGLAFKLVEPIRGRWEKSDVLGEIPDDVDPAPISVEAAFARLMRINTMRNVVVAFAAIGFSVFTSASLANLWIEEEFGIGSFGRGVIGTLTGLGGLLVLPFMGRYFDQLYRRRPDHALRVIGLLLLPVGLLVPIRYFMPNVYLFAAIGLVIQICTFASFSMVQPITAAIVPYRLRGLGASLVTLYIFFVGATGGGLVAAFFTDQYGIRVAVIALTMPAMFVGGTMIINGSRFMRNDLSLVVAELREEQAEHERQAADPEDIPRLQVNDIDFSYDSVQVLFDVAFEVRKGEVLALLGTNGAGKSTILRVIAGLGTPQRGVVRLDGRTVTYTTPEQRTAMGVHMLLGGKGVFDDMSVHQNLVIGAYHYRNDPADVERRIARVLDMFPDLAERLDQNAGSLSGGQQQMVALARTLLHDPEVLIIDELSLGLAPAVVQELLVIIEDLKAQGLTIIIVEQSLNIALAVADRAVFLEKGRVRFEGDAQELLERDDLARAVFLGTEGG